MSGSTPAGRERRGSVRADTADAARAQLVSRKLYVVRIEPAVRGDGAALLSRGLVPAAGCGAKQLTLFTRQLATLIQVSPLEEALRTRRAAGRARGGAARPRLGPRRRGRGRRLADAMAREPKSFPPLYRAMVAAGEGSGTLPRSSSGSRPARAPGAGARQGALDARLSDRSSPSSRPSSCSR